MSSVWVSMYRSHGIDLPIPTVRESGPNTAERSWSEGTTVHKKASYRIVWWTLNVCSLSLEHNWNMELFRATTTWTINRFWLYWCWMKEQHWLTVVKTVTLDSASLTQPFIFMQTDWNRLALQSSELIVGLRVTERRGRQQRISQIKREKFTV